ncbi:polysaccharide biosynthesis tyrosine autokinase [Gordonia sp. PKS22-38]|uniref:Polysaccharide biosynthesis tyrosine autokinase n=1 Tax=Gordonia prachuapensis TaxID=3115651 RepID=A0ABU7MYD2_9ACTN|nr:polysaccharide biosynthesis tyrosine autokinase [Gordonia sp. PKS22-38]
MLNQEVPTNETRKYASLQSLGALWRQRWWNVVLAALAGGVLAVAWALLQSPTYASTAVVYVTTVSDGGSQGAYTGSLASQQRVASYVDLASSDAVLSDAIEIGDLDGSVDDVRSAVTASAALDTVVLDITATATEPTGAAALANAVAEAMRLNVVELETPSGGGEPLAKLTVISPASPSVYPFSPQPLRLVAIGLFSGSVIGFLFMYLKGRFDTRLRSESDIEGLVDVPVLASVDSRLGMVDSKNDLVQFGNSPMAESFRRLQINLDFAGVEGDIRRLLIASGEQGEGKSTTTIHLALALADSGYRTLIVDSDLRRPTLCPRLGLNGEVGLTDIIRGVAEPGDVIQRTEVPNLEVLGPGRLPPNPVEFLNSTKSEELFRSLSVEYDYVIVDSPPVNLVADSSVLVRSVDGVLVVVRAGRTRRSELVSAVDQLRMAQATIAGVVLNGVSRTGAYREYGYTASNAGLSGSSR